MEDSTRRRLEKFEREEVFMDDNAADFPKPSPGDSAASVNKNIVAEMRTLAASQVSGSSSAAQSISNRDEGLDDLYQFIRNLNRAANAFEDEVAGSDLQFRLPRNRSQQNLLATARAFLENAAPLEAKFVEYGLPAGFPAELQSIIDAVEAEGSSADSGGAQQTAATAGLLDAARRGMNNSRKLDAIVRIKYQHNPQKLAAWTVASHLARRPQTAVKPTPPTP